MNNEIKEILDRLDFEEWEVDLYKVPITWCELYDIRDYITNLEQENEKLKKELNDISNISYKDYSVWATERRYLDTLDEFANDIKYKIAPNLTDSYRDGIKSALKHTIKYVKDNYKQETLVDYKSRIEKAIEYIEHFNSDEICENITGIANILLNILQNGSDASVE